MDLVTTIELILTGLAAGLAGGMLGVGGSIVMIPALTLLLGTNQHTYQAAAMIVNFFVVVPAVIQHRRAHAIHDTTVLRLIPVALVAVLIGVALSETTIFAAEGERYLRFIFACFLFFVITHDLYRLVRPVPAQLTAPGEMIGSPRTHVHKQAPWTLVCAIAVPTGVMAGLLGVGGGVLAVPLQRRLLRIPIRSAIANSAALIVATSLVGAMAKNIALILDGGQEVLALALAIILAPAAVAGSVLGSHLTHRLPVKLIKAAFLLLMVAAAIRLATA